MPARTGERSLSGYVKIVTFPDKLLMSGSRDGAANPSLSKSHRRVNCFEGTCCKSWTHRRDGRVAEGARLESVFTRKGNVGSNPTLSATPLPA
jgi:hypothetical protein